MNRTISAHSLSTESSTTIDRAIKGFWPVCTWLLTSFRLEDIFLACLLIQITVMEIIVAASSRIIPLKISWPIPSSESEILSVNKARIMEPNIPSPRPAKIYLDLPLISFVAAVRIPSIREISRISLNMIIDICSIKICVFDNYYQVNYFII